MIWNCRWTQRKMDDKVLIKEVRLLSFQSSSLDSFSSCVDLLHLWWWLKDDILPYFPPPFRIHEFVFKLRENKRTQGIEDGEEESLLNFPTFKPLKCVTLELFMLHLTFFSDLSLMIVWYTLHLIPYPVFPLFLCH